MNYTTIRDKYVTEIQAAIGTGRVFGRPRLVRDWPTFLSRFTVANPYDATKDVIKVVWFTRTSIPEVARKDEHTDAVTVVRPETWDFTVLYGFYDDDTDAHPSETEFQQMLDAILSRFRFLDRLGLSCVDETEPMQVISADIRMFGGAEGVLCHTGVLRQRVTQVVYT